MLQTHNEKKKLLCLLQSDRNDILWLKAVAMTRKSVPEVIQRCVCQQNLLSSDPQEIIKKLRMQYLLEPCLNIYCGYPQPLWYNGYHHSNYEIWDAIIAEVLKGDTLDRSFTIALREFLDNEYNRWDRFEKTRDSIWDSILSTSEKRGKTFFWLLQISCSQNQTNKVVWEKYFNMCDISEKLTAYQEIANHIESLEYYQDGSGGILDLFDKKIIFEYTYPLLDCDNAIKKFCDFILTLNNFKDEMNQKSRQQELHTIFITGIQSFYEKMPPRMQLTNVIVKATMKYINYADREINNILEKRRQQLIKIASVKRELFDDEYSLSNWN